MEKDNRDVKLIDNFIKTVLDSANEPACRLALTLTSNFTTEEIMNAIKKVKINKAGGVDSISNNMIKAGRTLLAPYLVDLFNQILALQYFPSAWCKALLIPIFKSGDTEIPDNYRGICLNSSISKLLTGF